MCKYSSTKQIICQYLKKIYSECIVEFFHGKSNYNIIIIILFIVKAIIIGKLVIVFHLCPTNAAVLNFGIIFRPRWVVPVLPKGELEVLLEAAIDLSKKGKFKWCYTFHNVYY